jgi:hypothetical protein
VENLAQRLPPSFVVNFIVNFLPTIGKSAFDQVHDVRISEFSEIQPLLLLLVILLLIATGDSVGQ